MKRGTQTEVSFNIFGHKAQIVLILRRKNAKGTLKNHYFFGEKHESFDGAQCFLKLPQGPLLS